MAITRSGASDDLSHTFRSPIPYRTHAQSLNILPNSSSSVSSSEQVSTPPNPSVVGVRDTMPPAIGLSTRKSQKQSPVTAEEPSECNRRSKRTKRPDEMEIACPFIRPFEDKPICEVVRQGRRGIQRHLRRIREHNNPDNPLSPLLIGGDAVHQADDPRWASAEVMSFLKHKQKRSAAAEKLAKRVYNRNHYARNTRDYNHLKQRLSDEVDRGQITSEAASEQLEVARSQLSVGWFHTRNRVKQFQHDLDGVKTSFNLAQTKIAEARTTGDFEKIREAEEHLDKFLDKSLIRGRTSESQNVNHQVMKGLAKMYLPGGLPIAFKRDADGTELLDLEGTHVPMTDSNGAHSHGDIITPPTWENPSRADFLTTLALVLPQKEWSDDPLHKRGITSVQHILSADKVSDVNPWLTAAEKNDILATFNTATKVAQNWWQQADSGEREAYWNEWQQVRMRVQESFLSNSSAIIFHKLVRLSAIRVTLSPKIGLR